MFCVAALGTLLKSMNFQLYNLKHARVKVAVLLMLGNSLAADFAGWFFMDMQVVIGDGALELEGLEIVELARWQISNLAC